MFSLFVEKFSNNGIDYLRLVESHRYTNSKGVRTVRKKSIYNIGPLKKFDDGLPNYVQRLKESFKNSSPLIPELLPYCSSQPIPHKYSLDIFEGDPDCVGHPKLFSHCLIERILEELGLISFFRRYKQLTHYEFDLLGFFRLLIYGRILNPSSKIQTVSQNNDYYLPVIKNLYEYNIYDTLDFLFDYKKSLINRINKSLIDSFNRSTNIVYYDVTNFYFEIDHPDNDFEDEDGNLIKGIRKMGVCKEERKLPIVQMGLFMDEQGVPISIETFPGNTLDHLTVTEALKNSVEPLNMKRFIFVGDRGMYRGNNTFHLINTNNGYIISKSIEKTNKEEKKWIYEEEGYIGNSAFKHKSRIIKRTVKDNDGKMRTIVEKVIVYWSEKFYKKQMAENKNFLNFIDRLEQNPENFRITKSQSKSIRKFLKKECMNDITGEILDSSKIKVMIDKDKINRYKRSFGYYQIVTSELDMEDTRVIEVYHGLTRIEDQFEIMKGVLDSRPLRVRTSEHIEAHLLTCMIALIVVRIIQNKIVEYKGRSKDKNWESGLSAERIQKALNKWSVELLSNDLYRFNNIDDEDLRLILDAFQIKIPTKLFRPGELRALKASIKITT